jgi:hypothetical protein
VKDLDWDWSEGRWFLGDELLRHAEEEGGGLYMDRAGK